MEFLQQFYGLQEEEYVKLNISFYKCMATPVSQSGDSNEYEFDYSIGGEEVRTDSEGKPPLLKNLLGEHLFSSLQQYFGTAKNEEDMQGTTLIVPEDCSLLKTYGVSFSPGNVTLYFLTFVIATLVLIILGNRLSSFISRKRKPATESVCEVIKLQEPLPVSLPKTDEESVAKEDSVCSAEEPPRISKDGWHLSYQCQMLKETGSPANSSVSVFLERTLDKMFKKLDNLLLRGLSDGQSLSQTCPATPRLTQRNPVRRQRMGSSPMLQTFVAPNETQERTFNEEEERAWEDFEMFSQKFQWKYPACKIETRSFNQYTMKLLYYFDRVCCIPRNTWETSKLVTNYVLYLVSTEMEHFVGKTGYRFIEFLGAGPAVLGTKVARPNEFTVLMVLQPPVMPECVFDSSCDSIPPGMVMISINITKLFSVDRKVASNAEVLGKYRLCLSAKEFASAAEGLIEDCLQSLYTRSRSVMERLPFQIKGAAAGTLAININTRALIGFGEADIKIRLIPVLPLPVKGWYQMPMVYARPTVADFEYKQNPERRYGINSDLLWQIDTGEFEHVFSSGVQSMMKHANVNSCHSVCLLILKGLLTAEGKNYLLDRGVFKSQHLETVMNFLLLESAPSQWTFEKLVDRFSDAVHFLKAAFGTGRLPHFFVNNPHLISKMPAVADHKVLIQKRQKNLLSDIQRETLEKNLQYLDMCLRDAGLSECVKEEFSGDMWEYEFFLFN